MPEFAVFLLVTLTWIAAGMNFLRCLGGPNVVSDNCSLQLDAEWIVLLCGTMRDADLVWGFNYQPESILIGAAENCRSVCV